MSIFGKSRKQKVMEAYAAQQAAQLKKQQAELKRMEEEMIAQQAKGVKAGMARRSAMGGGAGVRSGGALLSVQPAMQQGGLQTMLGGGNQL